MSTKRKTIQMKPFLKRIRLKIWEVVVVIATLILTYYLLALWGVIVLIMAGFARAGIILRRKATEEVLKNRGR